MTRSVGIDVGSHSIKIAELELSGKKREILGLYELPLKSKDEVAELLGEFFKNNSFSEGERLSVGIGNAPVITRTFHYPFTDKAKVKTAIEGEFEDTLPLNMEDYIVDFRLIKKVGKMNEFVAGMAPSDHVRGLNEVFEKCHLIPHGYYYDTEALSQLALSQCFPNALSNEIYGVVDFGYDATKIAILRGCRPGIFQSAQKQIDTAEILEMRSIPRGVRDLLEWIVEQKQMSLSEAKQWLEHRAVIKEVQENKNESVLSDEMSDELKTALRPVLVELYQTLQALRSRLSIDIACLHVTGGGAQVRGFRSFMSHELRLPVFEWDVLSGFSAEKIPQMTSRKGSFALAMALAHRYAYSKPTGWLNFRKSAQAMRRPLTHFLESLKQEHFLRGARFAGIVLALFYAHFFLGNYFFSQHESYLKKELLQTFQSYDPEIGGAAGRVLGDPEKAREFFLRAQKNKGSLEKQKIPRSKSDVLIDLAETLPAFAQATHLQVDSGQDETSLWKMNVRAVGNAPTLDFEKLQAQMQPLMESRGYQTIKFKKLSSNQALITGLWTGTNL